MATEVEFRTAAPPTNERRTDPSKYADELKKRHISVVLPVYKTAPYLRELLRRLVDTLKSASEDFEILMIDDGSPDGAWAIIAELARADRRVKGIRLSRNFGQHPAICAGFEHARGDVIVLMDADLQDPPEAIPSLLAHLQGDCDVVYTVKEGESEPPLTRLTSRIYHAAVSRITRRAIPRAVGTYRLFTRRVLEALLDYPERNILYGPLMFFVGFEATVVPVARQPRRGSGSSYTFAKRLSLAVESILSYTDYPHRFLVKFGGVTLALSLVYSLVLVLRYLFAADPLPPGLTLLALLISVSLGAMMMGLGVVGMYVFRVYQEVLARPRYVKSRTLNIEEHVKA
jgi:dolichol-phosphate mannosyltransferase